MRGRVRPPHRPNFALTLSTASSAFARATTCSSRVAGSSIFSQALRCVMPTPRSRNSGACRFLPQQRPGGGEYSIGEQSRLIKRRVAGSNPEVRRLKLEDDRLTRGVLRLGPPGHPLAHPPQNALERGKIPDIVIEGRFGADLFNSSSLDTAADVLAARQMIEPRAHASIPAHEVGLLARLDLANERKPVAGQLRLRNSCRRPRSSRLAGWQEMLSLQPFRSPRSRAASRGLTPPLRGICCRRDRRRR